MEPGEYHLCDGITFRRMPGDRVRVRVYVGGGASFDRVAHEVSVDASGWASAVAAVRACPETVFHGAEEAGPHG